MQSSEGVFDLLSKSTKTLSVVFCEKLESQKASVVQNNGRAYKYQVKNGQGYFFKYVLTWDLSRLETQLSFACFAVDQRHMMCVDQCLSLIIDLQTSSMAIYELPLILSLKCIQIITFLQNTHEPVNVLKRLQNILNIS